MFNLEKYNIIETLHIGKKNILYYAIDTKYKQSVVLKMLNKKSPSDNEINQLFNEFEITKSLSNINGVIKAYDYFNSPKHKVIVMEYADGDSLKKIINTQRINIKDFLNIGIKIVGILGKIHQENVIHRDIKPSNIVIDKNNNIFLIDFSLAKNTANTNSIRDFDIIEGSFQYIAPEQTGKLNKISDYRADYYSLGITFYEMLTGILPFKSLDPLELIHNHITKEAIPPHSVDKNIPIPISNIVMKLIEKNPEDRYQSSYGIICDLLECLKRYETDNEIHNFEIGMEDKTEKFQIPKILYGRNKEIEKLLEAFEHSREGIKTIVNVKGPSGIGKSFLIHKVKTQIIEQDGYFISGKFDLFKKDVPYFALIQALDNLGHLILTEKKEKQKEWKEKILKVSGNIGKIITNIAPIFEKIIGKQQDLQELGGKEAQNRFNILMENFIDIFATKDHPLVIFFDDMQWADKGSIELLEMILSIPQQKSLLIIFSYRDNEVDKYHPLTTMLENLNEKKLPITYLEIQQFSNSNIISMLKDMFKQSEEDLYEISNVIMNKTMGNPFFVKEFLANLYSENLIWYDNKWLWDIDKIVTSEITNNVVDLMVKKINRLPPENLKVIKISSCIDNWIYLDTLSYATGFKEEDIEKYIYYLIKEGVLVKYQHNYQFVHDKIREAAYSICNEEEKINYHYNIGKALIQLAEKENNYDKYLFNIINQWNICKLILTEEEKKLLCSLCFQAGNKAKQSGAFLSALKFLNNSIELLPYDSWTSNYRFTFDMYLAKAEVEYLVNKGEEAQKDFSLLIEKAQNKIDLGEVYYLQGIKLSNQADFKNAFKVANKALAMFNADLPERFYLPHLILTFIQTKLLLGNKNIETLHNLPTIEDKEKIIILKIYFLLGVIVINIKEELVSIVGLKSFNTTLIYGNSEESSLGYIFYAVTLATVMKDIKTAYQFGNLASQIIEKFKDNIYKTKVLYFKEFLINYRITNTRKNLHKYLEIVDCAKECGDIHSIIFSLASYFSISFYVGMPIDFIQKEIIKYSKYFFDIKNKFMNRMLTILIDMLKILSEDKIDPHLLQFYYYIKENVEIEKLIEDKDIVAFTYLLTLNIITNYFNEDCIKSKPLFIESDKYQKNVSLFIHYPIYLFFKAISIACYFDKLDKKEQKKQLKELEIIIKKYKFFAENGADNYLHKYYLIKAEYYKIQKDYLTAEQFYNESIKAVIESEYLNDEAIIYECVSNFYFLKGIKEIGELYIQKAYFSYYKLGLINKIKILENKYKNLTNMNKISFNNQEKDLNNSNPITEFNISESTSSYEILDIESIMKASAAISEEIEIKSLLEKMMKIVIQNAGADKGILILLNEKGDFIIEAEINYSNGETVLLQSKPIENSNILSENMIRYSAKMMKSINLNDKETNQIFINDSYLKENNPKSVFVFPLVKQAKLVGLIYLENKNVSNAFHFKHLKTIQLLSSQILISIENAKFIEVIKEKERLKQEMVIAKHIQTSLYPPLNKHKEFEISVEMKPATEVGGDYYDITYDINNDFWLAIGDVSGHGLIPGLIMIMAETSFNTIIKNSKEHSTPKDAIIAVNKLLYENINDRLKETYFMTMTFLKYKENGVFQYAGLNLDILIYRAKFKKIEIAKTNGCVLGIIDNIDTVTDNLELHIDIGDIILLYTDGITESNKRDSDKNLMFFGEEKIISTFLDNAEKPLEEIKNQIFAESLKWCDHKQKDDMTVMLVKRVE